MDDADPISLRERALSWLQATPAEAAGLALLLLGALVATAVFVLQAAGRPSALHDAAERTGEGGAAVAGALDVTDPDAHHHDHGEGGHGSAGDAPSTTDPGGVADDATPAEVVVHVTGAVVAPGVVTLDGGARVADAIAAAGGATGEARLDHLNLARPLEDGEHVHLPVDGEDPPPVTMGPGSGAGGAGGPGGGAGIGGGGDAPVDLNRATAEELQRLPGIGPSKAEAVVRHREQHGPFAVPGDLREVPGIGEKTFQQLADLVTVS